MRSSPWSRWFAPGLRTSNPAGSQFSWSFPGSLPRFSSFFLKFWSTYNFLLFCFTRAAQEAAPELVKSAFAIVQLVQNDFFEHIAGCFVDFISCLVEFAFNKCNEDIALSSIHLLQTCSKQVQDNPLEPPGMSVDDFFLRWFPIISGLSRVVIDCESLNVRKKGNAAFVRRRRLS